MAIGRLRHTYKLYMHTMRGKHLAIGRLRQLYIQAAISDAYIQLYDEENTWPLGD